MHVEVRVRRVFTRRLVGWRLWHLPFDMRCFCLLHPFTFVFWSSLATDGVGVLGVTPLPRLHHLPSREVTASAVISQYACTLQSVLGCIPRAGPCEALMLRRRAATRGHPSSQPDRTPLHRLSVLVLDGSSCSCT